MARPARSPSFPFPIPEPPPGPPRTTPFPPPMLRPEETAALPVLERRVAGIPVPFFFAIGAVLGILIAVTVVYVRRATSRRVTSALILKPSKLTAARSAPATEHARALFIFPTQTAPARAAPEEQPAFEVEDVPPSQSPPQIAAPAPRARSVAMTRAPHGASPAKVAPANILSAGL